MKKSALLLIDVQNDYFSGGKFPLPNAESVIVNISGIIEFFRNKKLPIIHIEHESIKEGSAFFLPGTEGQKIHPKSAPQEDETVIRKNYPNSFLNTPLHATLQNLGIEKLIIAGMMTFMCVDATTRAATDLGYDCILLKDCTTTPPIEFDGTKCTSDQAKASILAALSHLCSDITSSHLLIKSLAEK